MARISLAGFKDPKRRPRFIVWAVVAVLVIIAVMIPVLGVTSTYWFCAEGCHKVQDDTITAYQHSPHSEISCMACHMPVQANPVVFLLHKAEALGELYMTVTNKFELPLNAESEVALTMKSTQCTQCHDEEKRTVTPSPGLKIDHAVHATGGVECTICHNRTAHVEDFKLTLVDPTTGKPNRPHEDFMKMTACFRCHSQDASRRGAERRMRGVPHARIRAQAAQPPEARLLPEGPRQARCRRGKPHAGQRQDVVAQRRVDRDFGRGRGRGGRRGGGREERRDDRRDAAQGRVDQRVLDVPQEEVLHRLPRRRSDAAPGRLHRAARQARQGGPRGVRQVPRKRWRRLQLLPPRHSKSTTPTTLPSLGARAAPGCRQRERGRGLPRELPQSDVLLELPCERRRTTQVGHGRPSWRRIRPARHEENPQCTAGDAERALYTRSSVTGLDGPLRGGTAGVPFRGRLQASTERP